MLQYDLQAQDAVAALRLVCGSRPAFFASATVPSPDGQPQRTTAELARVRRFLPVHLKRFTQDAKVRSRFVKDSRSSPVSSSSTCRLSGLFSPTRMCLVAFCVHLGPSVDEGHYVTYRACRGLHGTTFTKFDDDKVTAVGQAVFEKEAGRA